MTNHAFLPEAILKELTATEDDVFTGFINTDNLLSMELDDLNREQENLYNMVDKECWLANSDNINNVTDVEKFVPWFLSCNPHRCPYWIGVPDPRNKDLLISIKDVALSLKQVPQSYWEKSSVRKLFKQFLNPIYKSRKDTGVLHCTIKEMFFKVSIGLFSNISFILYFFYLALAPSLATI